MCVSLLDFISYLYDFINFL